MSEKSEIRKFIDGFLDENIEGCSTGFLAENSFEVSDQTAQLTRLLQLRLMTELIDELRHQSDRLEDLMGLIEGHGNQAMQDRNDLQTVVEEIRSDVYRMHGSRPIT